MSRLRHAVLWDRRRWPAKAMVVLRSQSSELYAVAAPCCTSVLGVSSAMLQAWRNVRITLSCVHVCANSGVFLFSLPALPSSIHYLHLFYCDLDPTLCFQLVGGVRRW